MHSLTSCVLSAKRFALERHGSQCRPNASHEPIGIHLGEVASTVMLSGGSYTAIAVAWLHDAVEDAGVTIPDITTRFGNEVAGLVHGLTDPPTFVGMHINDRKRKQAERIATESAETRLVKIADQMSNIASVIIDPPSDWDDAMRSAYITGAFLVASGCTGISTYADHGLAELRKRAEDLRLVNA